MHYIGVETLSVPRPHGNCMRQTRIIIRIKSSVTRKIEESVKGNSDKPAHKIYKENLTEGQSVTDKPRNISQVHYIREKARIEKNQPKVLLPIYNNKFRSESKQLIQVMNTDPNGSGVHWFAFSTLGTGPSIVNYG